MTTHTNDIGYKSYCDQMASLGKYDDRDTILHIHKTGPVPSMREFATRYEKEFCKTED